MALGVATTFQKLDEITFDTLLALHDPFGAAAKTGSACMLDLSGVKLVTPAGMVQLAAACHALDRVGRRPTIVISDPNVRSYLCRAGWVKAVSPIADIRPVTVETTFGGMRNRGGNPMLLEVTKVDSGAALPELLDQIVWVLRHRMKYRKYDAFDVATAVSEISQNTFDHNASTFGFIAMQVYGKGNKRFVQIGVADHGDGLRATLRRNPVHARLLSDAKAITTAIELGTSEYQDRTRGTGLHHLLEIAYKHEGVVQIRSGNAKVRYRMDKKQGWILTVAGMPGVQIALTLKAKSAA